MASEEPARSSAGSSSRGSGGRSRQNPQQQLSTIEKSVTHLLVATKQLLETLTLWSRSSATESEVSDVYVRLGYEFNIACRAFNAIGVETNDLGPVPDLLRQILEDTLSQEASQQSLDRFLPRIRDIIIGLLHGLKKKQQRLRQKTNTNGESSGATKAARQASTASSASVETSLTQQLEDGMAPPSRHSSSRSFAQRQGSGDLGTAGPDLPPRTSSVASAAGGGGGRSSPRRSNLSPQNSMHERQGSSSQISLDTTATNNNTPSSVSSAPNHTGNSMNNIPTFAAPYPEQDTIPTNQGYESNRIYQPSQPSPELDPPPRPPPKQNDALAALQKGGDLERRASRRFSAYQIQKHLGGTMGGMGAIPPAQHSPLPNRGRDVRESMSAVRSRASVRARSQKVASTYEPSPNRHDLSRRISEEPSELAAQPTPPIVERLGVDMSQADLPYSPTVKTPEDKLGEYPFPASQQQQQKERGEGGLGATLNGPIPDVLEPADGDFTPVEVKRHESQSTLTRGGTNSHRAARYDTPPQSQYTPEGSPQAGKELTLFLQYKSKIKKYVLDGGELSIPRLQLAFIEKFAWSTQNNGVDLPEIYIQDPVSGVRYELDGLGDIKDRSVLVLNVEALDEVKRHFDDGIGGLRQIIKGIQTSVEEHQGSLKLVSERQQETAKNLAGITVAAAAAAPVPVARTASSASTSTSSSGHHTRTLSVRDRTGQLDEIRGLRRDLAVVRQTYTSFVSDTQATMAALRTKALEASRRETAAPVAPKDINAGRAHVNAGKVNLSGSSEKIVNTVDDLQDVVEDLRKDVVLRGVRPLPRQLETVSKDISLATAELKKLQEFLRKEKPVWTKIWERELQVVCDERELLTMQEELVMDLEDDLEKASGIFGMVERVTREQGLVANPNLGREGGQRSGSGRMLKHVGGAADPEKSRDGVLGEVRALQPNHESRLEAIERAEKARQRELESRKGGEFQRELGAFVEDNKLKKSGGVEEVERQRKAREEKTRREVHENILAREHAKAEKAAEREAERARQKEQPVNGSDPNGVPESGSQHILDVPVARDPVERESSPEPEFVEAKEEVNGGGTESSSVTDGSGT